MDWRFGQGQCFIDYGDHLKRNCKLDSQCCLNLSVAIPRMPERLGGASVRAADTPHPLPVCRPPGYKRTVSFEPFIVTAELPARIFTWADGLRRTHFPPERNHLAAHVTLFHSLAPSLRQELPAVLARISSEYAPPAAELTGLMNLGRGTALALRSPGMQAIRSEIADLFHGMLTAQDQPEPRLHITIQNKVSPDEARRVQAALEPTIKLQEFAFTGLGLHRYCNPHWEAVGIWPFRGKVSG